MSLDVYLELEGAGPRPPGSGIFIREDGQTKEITREEWDARFPDREPFTCHVYDPDNTVYHNNITHNLGGMAREAEIYEALWHPEAIGITRARQLIGPLKAGLVRLQNDPGRYKELNPENGWGTYGGLVKFVTDYLAACEKNPDAVVTVWR
jgi:hypothetical protein